MVQGEAGRCQLMLFGIPTLIIADDPPLLAAARAALADWLVETPRPEPEIILRLVRDDRPADGVSPDIRAEGSRLAIHGGGISGTAEARTGRADCRVPNRLIETPGALADEVLDPLLLFIATRRGRAPLHAAGVMMGSRAIVLAGPSGSGKSTLALNAAARGCAVLSDDTVYVEHDPHLRIWGMPHPIHVFPDHPPAGCQELRLRNGKLKRAVPLGPGSLVLSADRAVLVVLARGESVSLDPIAPVEAAAELSGLEPGFDLLPAESAAAVAALTAAGAWRLRLTCDPQAAIDLLEQRFG